MPEPKPWIRPADVVEAVEEWTGIDREHLLARNGHQQKRRLHQARMLMCTALAVVCEMSNAEVGRYVGTDRSLISKYIKETNEYEVVVIGEMARDIRDGLHERV